MIGTTPALRPDVTMDSRFRVDLIAATPNPQQCVYAAMHQDYSEGFVAADRNEWPDETRAGEICVKRLLAGERGHYGPLEHAQIVLCGLVSPFGDATGPHPPGGVSFDVQSMRYTGERIARAADGTWIWRMFSTSDQWGTTAIAKARNTPTARRCGHRICSSANMLPSATGDTGWIRRRARPRHSSLRHRQHFVVSFSLRAFLHFMDLRAKLDAQQEIRELCDLMWPHLQQWAPEFATWYEKTRLHKARLAP